MNVQIKEMLLKTGAFQDNVVCHLVSGLGAGFFAVCFGSPVDVVKSRLMGLLLSHLPIIALKLSTYRCQIFQFYSDT